MGNGITWLKNNGFFGADYYPYNAGGLLSVKTSKKINRDSNNVIIGEYPLDDIELRGILKLDDNNNLYYDGDIYESNGSVTRKYDKIDFDNITWIADSGYFYSTTISGTAKENSDSFNNVGLKSSYQADMCLYIGINGWIFCFNSSISTVSDLETYLTGKSLVYELTTPTTETADAFTNPMIVDGNGTEEFVDGRTVEMPVGHDTFYIPMN